MDTAHKIRQAVAEVDQLRHQTRLQPALGGAVTAIKRLQAKRFAGTYADLLSSGPYMDAARFFLEELYGPQDFSQRDAQFARVVPALVRLFPPEIVATVATLARLHALSETLDSAMGAASLGVNIDRQVYIRAWQATGRPQEREQQIALTVEVGRALDRLTRKALVRHSLHLMRGPARAAGLGALQQFLESGFDTFRAMGGADHFLDRVGQRERELATALFAPDAAIAPAALGQLP